MFKYAIDLVLRRKLRTILTSLGITIAVFLLSFIIFGMQDLQRLLVDSFNSQFQPNFVTVSTTGLSSFTGGNGTFDQKKERTVITNEVIKKIEEQGYTTKVDPSLVLSGLEINLQGFDVPFDQAFMSGWDIKGDNTYFITFTGTDMELKAGEIYLSHSVAKYFKLEDKDLLGKKVILKPSKSSFFSNKSKNMIGKSFTFTVVGVYEVGQDKNDAIMSLDDALKIQTSLGGFKDTNEYVENIGYDAIYMDAKEDKIQALKDYVKSQFNLEAMTSADLISFLGNITKGLTIALVMFGFVSALVASIGIINTMIMSIYEQTKEIGIIKSIGASNFQVLIIFLIQSGIIGFIGGFSGLLFIFGIMKLADPFVVSQLKNAGFNITTFFHFDLKTALMITIVSILVGVVAGIYPAIKAARLDPVKALRYE